ncbi:MAG: PASTA domain-containing protein [Flammeovirgaceae bacterium]
MLLIFAVVVLLFFFVYLPITTNHGELLTVPEVLGKTESEIATIFEEHSLRYEIIDTNTYNAAYELATVIGQNPSANSQVKENRKIYITMNPTTQPTVKIPVGMISKSIRNAQEQLKTAKLTLGEIKEIPNKFRNVIALEVNGKELSKRDIKKGYFVKTWQTVNLIVGNGNAQEQDPDSLLNDND